MKTWDIAKYPREMAVFGRRDGGEGGIDSQLCLGVSPRRRKRRRPKRFRVLSNPTRLLTHPSPQQKTRHKARLFVSGGEGGIRTLDTLPYTHFPGVLLQPLGHLTQFKLLVLLQPLQVALLRARYRSDRGCFRSANSTQVAF